MATHEYHRAIEFYERSLGESFKNNTAGSREFVQLSYDLARYVVFVFMVM